MMRLNYVTYPPEPQCSDDLMPEDLPDALETWERECDRITIEQLQAKNKEMRDYILNEARHGAGCSRELGKKYRCSCGLSEFQQALKEKK